MLRRLTVLLMANGVLVGAIVFVTRKYQPRSNQPKLQSKQETKAPQPSPAEDQTPGDDENNRQPQTPWWYIFLTWPTGITTWAVILTLEGIIWQSVEMRLATQQMSRSAKATEDSVMAFIASQGPQIVVMAHGHPPTDLLGETARVQMEMHNNGLTAAYDLIQEYWAEILPFEAVDFTEKAHHDRFDEPLSIYPRQQPVILNIPLGRTLDSAERQAIRNLKKKACFRIRITYRDGFAPPRRWYANFGYWVQYDGLGFMSKYNDSGIEDNR